MQCHEFEQVFEQQEAPQFPADAATHLNDCEQCRALVHRREVQLANIVTDLPPVFKEYYENPALRVCRKCGHHNPGKPAARAAVAAVPA